MTLNNVASRGAVDEKLGVFEDVLSNIRKPCRWAAGTLHRTVTLFTAFGL
jgi:hypothetical protein